MPHAVLTALGAPRGGWCWRRGTAAGSQPVPARPTRWPGCSSTARPPRLLLVLDNCERLVDAAAALADAIAARLRAPA